MRRAGVAIAQLRRAARRHGEPKEIGHRRESREAGVRRQPAGPAHQQWHAAGGLAETLLLPRAVIAQVITVVGKEADERSAGIRTRLDGVQNPPDAVVDECDRSEIARAQPPRLRG